MNRGWRLPQRPARGDIDTRRARRVSQVLEVAERFVYDLGLLISGERVQMSEYVDPGPVERLRAAVRPALAAGARTRPDFGEYAQVRIEGDLLDLSLPVWTVVEFDDRSTRLDHDGMAIAHERRRVRVQLLLDGAATRVLDHRIELVPEPTAPMP